ncbi:hypothetical protein MBLNU230_g7573t1 [Neophaeotheca triangularis]
MTTPRVFIIRHGETEWSLNGRHTGISDIPLTANGEKRILATGRALVGTDRLIIPQNLAHVFVSPRSRAQRTLELLGVTGGRGVRDGVEVETTDAIAEWDYGDYEGVTSGEIRRRRGREQGLPEGQEAEWDIWHDGCPGGESPAQVTARVDALIERIRREFHAPAIGQAKGSVQRPYDVLIVAHGHILRALAGRWIGQDIARNPSLILEAGGVGTLSYEHAKLAEPAILLGGAFMSDVVENAEEEQKGKDEGER